MKLYAWISEFMAKKIVDHGSYNHSPLDLREGHSLLYCGIDNPMLIGDIPYNIRKGLSIVEIRPLRWKDIYVADFSVYRRNINIISLLSKDKKRIAIDAMNKELRKTMISPSEYRDNYKTPFVVINRPLYKIEIKIIRR